jgi:hypothetical protein
MNAFWPSHYCRRPIFRPPISGRQYVQGIIDQKEIPGITGAALDSREDQPGTTTRNGLWARQSTRRPAPQPVEGRGLHRFPSC